jgi:hypothetical protein
LFDEPQAEDSGDEWTKEWIRFQFAACRNKDEVRELNEQMYPQVPPDRQSDYNAIVGELYNAAPKAGELLP